MKIDRKKPRDFRSRGVFGVWKMEKPAFMENAGFLFSDYSTSRNRDYTRDFVILKAASATEESFVTVT